MAIDFNILDSLPILDTKTVCLRLITPDAAKMMLENNYKNNRPLREYPVHDLARALKIGAWKIPANIDAIVISRSGEILNGQHRLSAIVEADTPAPLYLVFGAEDEEYAFMDSGVKRTLADVIETSNAKSLASIALTCFCIEHGDTGLASSIQGKVTPKESPSRQEVLDYQRENAEALEAAVHAARNMRAVTKYGSEKVYGAFFKTVTWLYGDDNVVDWFVEDFKNPLSENKTVQLLKTEILKAQIRKTGYQAKTDKKTALMALLITGYENYKEGTDRMPNNKAAYYFKKWDDAIRERREKWESQS